MSANIVPFKNFDTLPAHIKARMGQVDNSALGTVSSGGFPVISLKGKRFSKVFGGKREIINDPRTDEPANAIELAIIRVNPGMSKAYYATGYQEGADAKPDCFSNDGIKPDAQARDPQAKSCAACPFNSFGSSTTGKGKACPDTKRMAVAPIDNLEEPMLLRVPPTSLKNLAEFGATFQSKGVDIRHVATKVAFDPQATHQLLTFKGIGFLTEEIIEQVQAMQDDETVLQITGEKAFAPREAAPAPAPVAAPKPKAKLVVIEDEDEEEEAPVAPPVKAKKAKPVVIEDEDEDEVVVSAKDFLAKQPAKKAQREEDPELADEVGSFLEGGFDDD